MKEKILAFLRNRDGFVSGQTICEELGVSRTAIWKYINVLREEGYEIESVTRKGYRLLQSPDVVTREELLGYLPAHVLAGEIRYYNTVDSTNEAAKRAASAGISAESIFIADRQTSGKGRRGRVWSSPGGEDVFFSILLRPDLSPEAAPLLTLVAALAAVETAGKHSGEACQIKWPNDIVLHDKKICGILTEMSVEMDEIDCVVVGVGFNLNRLQFDSEIEDMAGSIRKETGKRIIRAAFLADFIQIFMDKYHRFLEEESFSMFVEAYNDHLINKGRQVRLVRRGQELLRTALGINEKGELILEDENGTIETVLSGEVSVRGLYGYV
ncbi:MAG: biotin--[Eubacterium sp.]|nr:biotin--[acetyl-CoA-carboxylase] ligase [Eubacterium sp.]